MVTTGRLFACIEQAVRNEVNPLDGISARGALGYPAGALAGIIGRAIFKNRSSVFGGQAVDWVLPDHPLKSERSVVLFRHESHEAEPVYFRLQVLKAHLEDEIYPQLRKLHFKADQQAQTYLCILLRGTEWQRQLWTEKWNQGQHVPLTFTGKASLCQSGIAEGTPVHDWLILAEVHPSPATDKINVALHQAVEGVRLENTIALLRRIISLRTNLPEDEIQPDMFLSTLFKMVFAKEQNVSMEEVYDPEAFAGFTDTQLAVRNMLSDMQKAFSIHFQSHEMDKLSTVEDLAKLLLLKTG